MFDGDLPEHENLAALGRHPLFNELVIIMARPCSCARHPHSMTIRKTSAGISWCFEAVSMLAKTVAFDYPRFLLESEYCQCAIYMNSA